MRNIALNYPFSDTIPNRNRTETNRFAKGKEFFEELKKQEGFLEKYEGEFIAIKDRRILDIENNYSDLVNKVFTQYPNADAIYITMITKKERIAHFDTPF